MRGALSAATVVMPWPVRKARLAAKVPASGWGGVAPGTNALDAEAAPAT